MQKKSAGSENLIGVGGSTKDGASKIWSQLVVGLLSYFKTGFWEGSCVFSPLLIRETSRKRSASEAMHHEWVWMSIEVDTDDISALCDTCYCPAASVKPNPLNLTSLSYRLIIIIIIVHCLLAASGLWHSIVQDLGIQPIYNFPSPQFLRIHF